MLIGIRQVYSNELQQNMIILGLEVYKYQYGKSNCNKNIKMLSVQKFQEGYPYLQGLPFFQLAEQYSPLEYSQIYEEVFHQQRKGIVATDFTVVPEEWNKDLEIRPYLSILIEEEYVQRLWVWNFYGTESELVEDFVAGRFPTGDSYFPPYYIGYQFYGQIIDGRECKPIKSDFKYVIHVHESDDTFLQFGGMSYSIDGVIRDENFQSIGQVPKKIIQKPKSSDEEWETIELVSGVDKVRAWGCVIPPQVKAVSAAEVQKEKLEKLAQMETDAKEQIRQLSELFESGEDGRMLQE